MKVNFKDLEDYLLNYGYPKNELMQKDYFVVPEQTSYEYLINNIKKFANYNAMTFYGRNISYEEFANQIEKTANAMKGIEVADGDKIATLLPNIPEAAYMQYGSSKIGAIPSNIDPRTSGKMLLNYIKKENIKDIVVVDVMYNSAIRPVEHELKEIYGIDKIVVIPATNSLPKILKNILNIKSIIDKKESIKSDVLSIIYWDDLISDTLYENAENISYRKDKDAIIEHSSGTSKGTPKSIPLTNENINMFVEKHKPTIFNDLPYGTKLLHILPYFASYGAINSAHLGFNLGLTLQEIPEFNFKDFGYIAAKQKSEILIGVPNWFNLASKDTRIKGEALKNVKMAISGGDSNDEKGKKAEDEFLLSHGAKCIETNGHGMSELGGSGCYTFPGHENGLGVGIPFPYDKYIILDNEGNIVPLGKNGSQGCVWIYSPSATNGIFNGEKFAETKEINGFRFLNSKDTMHISPNYEISFIEREDRTFTRFDGHKIVAFDIENKFKKNQYVKQCMIVPYEDEDIMGKMPIAYVIPTEELNDSEKYKVVSDVVNEMINSEDTNDRDIPRKVCFIDELPQNAMSKNDYRSLINRKIDGTEYTIDISETNLKSGDVNIISPLSSKTKRLVLK